MTIGSYTILASPWPTAVVDWMAIRDLWLLLFIMAAPQHKNISWLSGLEDGKNKTSNITVPGITTIQPWKSRRSQESLFKWTGTRKLGLKRFVQGGPLRVNAQRSGAISLSGILSAIDSFVWVHKQFEIMLSCPKNMVWWLVQNYLFLFKYWWHIFKKTSINYWQSSIY